MNWCSAKVTNVSGAILEELEPLANICAYLPGGRAEQRPLMLIDYWWCDVAQIDFAAFKPGLLDRVLFVRSGQLFSSAVQQLIAENRKTLALEWRCENFEIVLSIDTGYVRLFVNTKSPDYRWIHDRLNYFPSYHRGTFVSKDPLRGTREYTTEWVPIDGTLEHAVNTGTNWRIGELLAKCSFWDDDLQVPEAVEFLLPATEVLKIAEILHSVSVECGAEISIVDLVDRPDKVKPQAPFLQGIWDIHRQGNYRPEIDLLKRPEDIEKTCRYPLIQRKEYHRSGHFKNLHWQLDVVHTPSGSFLDVQTSLGSEFLLDFLKEHHLDGEIWGDRFAGRL